MQGLCRQLDSFFRIPQRACLRQFFSSVEQTRNKSEDESGSPTPQNQSLNCQTEFSASVFTLTIDRLLAELDRRYNFYQDVHFFFFNTFNSTSAEEIFHGFGGKLC